MLVVPLGQGNFVGFRNNPPTVLLAHVQRHLELATGDLEVVKHIQLAAVDNDLGRVVCYFGLDAFIVFWVNVTVHQLSRTVVVDYDPFNIDTCLRVCTLFPGPDSDSTRLGNHR